MDRRQTPLLEAFSSGADRGGVSPVVGNIRVMAAGLQAGIEQSGVEVSEGAGAVDGNCLAAEGIAAGGGLGDIGCQASAFRAQLSGERFGLAQVPACDNYRHAQGGQRPGSPGSRMCRNRRTPRRPSRGTRGFEGARDEDCPDAEQANRRDCPQHGMPWNTREPGSGQQQTEREHSVSDFDRERSQPLAAA